MKELTQDYLKSVVSYNNDTGVFKYKKYLGGKTKAGKVAGDNGRYKRIWLLGRRFSIHHLVILYVDGYLPSYKKGDRVDHKDRNTHNNIYENLLLTDATGNNKNVSLCKDNTSGLAGVFKIDSGWRVRVQQKGKRIQVYSGTDFFEACCKRLSYNNKNNFNQNHGRIKKEYNSEEVDFIKSENNLDAMIYCFSLDSYSERVGVY